MNENKGIAAVIMAGGRGERLIPITDTVPKPIVPIGSGSAIECGARMLFEAGIKECAVTVRYRAEEIKKACGSNLCGVDMKYFEETLDMGTAGGVRAAAEIFGCGDELIVVSGDAVCDFLLLRAVALHRLNRAEATLILARSSEPERYGVVVTDDDGRITDFREKPDDAPPGSLVNTGIYVLSRRAVEMIPADCEYDFGREFFPAMLRRGERIFGCIGSGYWCDMGTPETYLDVCHDAATGKIRGLDANVEPSGAIVGKNVRVGDDCLLSGSVLHDGVSIGSEVRARGAILCRGVTIGSRVTLGEGVIVGEGCYIGDGIRVPSGTKIAPNSKLESGAGVFAENL